MYRNPEHYPDPTAGAALCQLRRKENRLNTGKQFEADWKKSMPPDAWCYRLKDSAATYYGGNENLSFPGNPSSQIGRASCRERV